MNTTLYSVFLENSRDDNKYTTLLGTFTTEEKALEAVRKADADTAEEYKRNYGENYSRDKITDRHIEYKLDWYFDETIIWVVQHQLDEYLPIDL